MACFGDGTEEKKDCSQCGFRTWHRGGKCLPHDMSAPMPYELLKADVEEYRAQSQALQEDCSARVAEAEKHLRGIEASCAVMRESLEYVRGRIGSGNIGESLSKIDRALSSLSSLSSAADSVKAA